MPREFSRKQRVAAEMRRLLNELLHYEVKDPRLFGVTVNDVEVSGDLGVAKVYFGTLDPNLDPAEAQAGFEKAAGFLRSKIGQSLRLRRTPELHFFHDVSAQRGIELTHLIEQVAPRHEDAEVGALGEDEGDDSLGDDGEDDGDDADDGDDEEARGGSNEVDPDEDRS